MRRGAWRIWIFIGLSLCLYAWHLWSGIRPPPDDELDLAIELRYQQEVAAMQQRAARMQELAGGKPAAAETVPINISPEWEAKFRQAIRHEQLAPLETKRRNAYFVLSGGLFALVIGAGSLAMALAQRRAGNQAG